MHEVAANDRTQIAVQFQVSLFFYFTEEKKAIVHFRLRYCLFLLLDIEDICLLKSVNLSQPCLNIL